MRTISAPTIVENLLTYRKMFGDFLCRMVRAMLGIRDGLRGAKDPCSSRSSRGTRPQFLSRGLAIACGALEKYTCTF